MFAGRVAPTQCFRQLKRAMHFHCTKRKPQHLSATELLKHKLPLSTTADGLKQQLEQGENTRGCNDLASLSSSHTTQFLDLACGKTSFWGYPQAVRRLTLISAGARDNVQVAY